ncbi:putative ribonuclease H-like domain-containing protein [Tanacetum coccineum]
MTVNKCYLTEYEDYDGGFVSFRDGKGRISGKGKIKTGTLDFDNVKESNTKPLVRLNPVNSISKPLHMDLFGVTNVKSLMKKSYYLIVTNDFSRFSSVFFLATKDETSGILKTFITEIENQLDYEVKVIRSDNGTEFKNSVMNQFCKMKGIKREFSIARTPQQDGVAERRNRKLIEAARTMLVDSKLPTTFWAEAVNTACYVLNRVLVIKPHTKTPYELIHERTPLIDFMKPFGCPVTILNTRDHLGKFEGKAVEGFFVGYSMVSKAMRVFNKRTRIVEETLNIIFLENAPNVTGNGPDWLFDVDSLPISMNYVPVVVGNQSNGIAGTRDNIIAGQAEKKTKPEQEYILIPFCTTDPLISQGPKDNEEYVGMKPTEVNESGASNKGEEDEQDTRSEFERLIQQEKQTNINAAEASNAFEDYLFERFSPFKNDFALLHVPNVFSIDDTGIFGNAYDDEDMGANADLNNLETTMTVSPIPKTRIDKDHTKDQILGDFNSAIQTRRMNKISDEHAMKVIQALADPSWVEAMQEELLIEVIRLFLAYASFMGFIVYHMDVKSAFLYGTIEEEVYVYQPPGFEDPHFPDKVYEVEKALYGLHQAPRAWYETLSTYLIEKGFRRGTIDKTLFIKKDKGDILFDAQEIPDEFYGGTHFLLRIASITKGGSSTPIETNKALVKDEEAKAVDVHLYRSIIGSLMYLTTSRHDIMFVVCACVRFQVTPKTSHILAVKRIFRYLKGQPKLGLWYPRDSSFDLEAFSDNDYAGASLDRKSTIGEYVATTNCCGQTAYKEWEDRMERAATTASSLEAKQDSGLRLHPNSPMIYLSQELTYLEVEEDKNENNGNDENIVHTVELIHYALTVNPTIYTSCIEQFWATTKVKTVNGERHLH